ncbi:MAG: twin transmembrane helix small protein [Alphaproteobacteria bacterium]
MEMLKDILPYLVGVALFAVLAVLATGIVAMFRGGDFNAKYGNKLMRWRVITQGIAIGLLALMLLLATQS